MPSRQAALKVSSSKPSLSLLFSFSLQTSCLGPCPLGKWKVICLEELLAQWENLLVLDNQRTACELQKLHVIRFCNPIRPECVILNQENYVMSSPVSLKWKVVIKWVNRCLAIYFDITLVSTEVMWVFFLSLSLCAWKIILLIPGMPVAILQSKWHACFVPCLWKSITDQNWS